MPAAKIKIKFLNAKRQYNIIWCRHKEKVLYRANGMHKNVTLDLKMSNVFVYLNSKVKTQGINQD